jgi:hypothetical protein
MLLSFFSLFHYVSYYNLFFVLLTFTLWNAVADVKIKRKQEKKSFANGRDDDPKRLAPPTRDKSEISGPRLPGLRRQSKKRRFHCFFFVLLLLGFFVFFHSPLSGVFFLVFS